MSNLTEKELDFFLKEVNSQEFEQIMFDEFHRETLENLISLRSEVERVKTCLDYQIARMEIRYKKIY